jgi:hypothetical protein
MQKNLCVGNANSPSHNTFWGIEQNRVAELYKDYLRAMGSTIVLGWKKKCNITIVHHSPYLVQFILQLCNAQTSSSKFKKPPYNPSQLQVTQLFWILSILLTSILKTHHIHSLRDAHTMGKRSQPYSFNRQETMNFLPALIKIYTEHLPWSS